MAYWGELTQIHPFRDGNTRTQVAFFERLSVAAGHRIRFAGIDVDHLLRLRMFAMSDSGPLAAYLLGHVGD